MVPQQLRPGGDRVGNFANQQVVIEPTWAHHRPKSPFYAPNWFPATFYLLAYRLLSHQSSSWKWKNSTSSPRWPIGHGDLWPGSDRRRGRPS